MRTLLAFLEGFIAGMLFLLGALWMSGTLQPVHSASRAEPAKALAAVVATADGAGPDGVPDIGLPVQGANPGQILDTFAEGRGNHRHEATDIMAPRGTPVLAVDDGKVAKLFLSRAGGITIYQFDPSETWCYYYAHLDRYAAGLVEDGPVHRGQVIGYVGSTGDASAEAPHLHFAIFRLGPEKHWWQGTPINPYPILMRHRAPTHPHSR